MGNGESDADLMSKALMEAVEGTEPKNFLSLTEALEMERIAWDF